MMFKKRTISSRSTIEFWQKKSIESNERRLRDHLFQFSSDKEDTIIRIENEGLILRLGISSLQARILNAEKVMIVEISNRMRILYAVFVMFPFLFALLQCRNNLFASIIIILIFGLILFSHYQIITKEILAFESILENNARIG